MTVATDQDALRDAASLDALYGLLEPLSINAGWAKKQPAMWPQPRQNFRPMHWRWSDAYAAFQSAGRLVDTEQAERRNLILYNPVGDNSYATARTIVTAYQMIKPGEKARSHRHAANALRLVLQGTGAYTVVDGERIEMEAGDVVLTPGSTWHGHGDDGEENCYWLDFLDVPLVQLTEAMFFEGHPDGFEPVLGTAEKSPNLFRWRDVEPALREAAADPDGRYGQLVELDSAPVRSLRLYMQRLTAGKPTKAFRTTANQVFAVVKGSGRTIIDGEAHEWSAGDVLVVPCWRPFSHEASDEAVLFCVSDERMQAFLGLYRTAD